MITINSYFIISFLLTQSIFASDIQTRRSICDSTEMDRIARAVVQDLQLREANEKKSIEEKSWRQRHPMAFGALLGFGIGFGFTVFAATGDETNFPIAVLFFGGIGAGIGVLIGSFF
jgi:hypothetical protein